jgi:hypothetical protein
MRAEDSVDNLKQVPNPEEDLRHARALLARMSPEELIKATDALEEIVEQSPWFRARLDEAEKGPFVSMDDVLADFGIAIDESGANISHKRGEAA